MKKNNQAGQQTLIVLMLFVCIIAIIQYNRAKHNQQDNAYKGVHVNTGFQHSNGFISTKHTF